MGRFWLVAALLALAVEWVGAQEAAQTFELRRPEITIMDIVSALQAGGVRANIELPSGGLRDITIIESEVPLKELLRMAKEDFGYDYHEEADGYTFYDPNNDDTELQGYLDKPVGAFSFTNMSPYEAIRSFGPALKVSIVSPKYARNSEGQKVTLQGDFYTFREALGEVTRAAGFMGWTYMRSNNIAQDKPVVLVYFGLYRGPTEPSGAMRY